jgi:2-polyprenyl-6-methoxyphenol hydroxylase-like FAD-dependent oxidoreductase
MAANATMMTALDAIRNAFSLQAQPVSALRNATLGMINSSDFVRNRIMKYAMGM